MKVKDFIYNFCSYIMMFGARKIRNPNKRIILSGKRSVLRNNKGEVIYDMSDDLVTYI